MELTGNVRIASGKDGLISVEVDDKDPKFAANLANAHVEELRNLLGRLAVTEAQQRRLFFEKQLQLTKENLAKADLALKSSGINSSALKSSPSSAVEAVATPSPMALTALICTLYAVPLTNAVDPLVLSVEITNGDAVVPDARVLNDTPPSVEYL